ncbi:MAG: squalene/phytoene synthase family protein [Deltaproteobacteria bacterium]|nr:squalene/phytoene synthase family protein [Deltaproteobacteria bacterium]
MHTHIPYIDCPDCSSVLKGVQSGFFASFKFLSQEKKDALFKVYAFFRIIDDCVDEVATVDEKRHALDYWKAELVNLYNRQTAHPVLMEMGGVIDRFQIPQGYFIDLIEGCESDITKNRYQNFNELYEYCYRVAGCVGLACLKIFEYESPTAEKMAVDLGLAFQLTNIIRDVKNDLARGRIYLPLEDMGRHGYSAEELSRGVENRAFAALLNDYTVRAQMYYQSASEEFELDVDGKLRAARVMAAYYQALLRKIVRKGFPVLRYRVDLNFFEKTQILMPFMFRGQCS